MAPERRESETAFYYRHGWKNLLLILLSLSLAPVTLVVVWVSLAVSELHHVRTRRSDAGRERGHAIARQQRKTILITGVSMTKGLAIARNLSQHSPHRIIGADVSALSPGRFSYAIAKYYRLDSPSGDDAEPYIDSLLSILRREKVDLWISCSSVVAAVEDGRVVQFAKQQAKEQGRRFEAVQFKEEVVEKFHEKDRFIDYIASLDLTVPESYLCTSQGAAIDILMRELHRHYANNPKENGHSVSKPRHQQQKRRFIMKPIGVDDKARNNMMTLLPFSTIAATTEYIRSLQISKSNPFQLQQFIQGKEYCTHALVVRGKVKLFTSCPSSELLMHYEPLPADSLLNQEMLKFTERVCKANGDSFTGHLSFDFFVEDEDASQEDLKLYPIESNPRAHTAVVLFERTPEMADAYISALNDSSCFDDYYKSPPVFPRTPTRNYYWIGHDLISLVFLPLLDFLFRYRSRREMLSCFRIFWSHLVYWKDGTFAMNDPWPFFVLYHVYWPAQFFKALINRKPWSR